jgi:hypothetical protein
MCSDSFGVQLSNGTFPNKVSCVSYFQVLDFIKRYIGSATPLIAGNSVYMDLLFLKVSKRTDSVIFLLNLKWSYMFEALRYCNLGARVSWDLAFW